MYFFKMQHNYRNICLVVIDGDVYVYDYEKYKFGQPFLSFQGKYFRGKFLLVNQKFAK